MVPDGPIWTIFIRVSVLFFRSITPLCICHSVLYVFGLAPTFAVRQIRPSFELITIPETLFYLLVYLPRTYVLQRPTANGNTLSLLERRALFETCWESVPDMEHFVRTWFKGVSVSEIRRQNVRDWLAWGFWNESSALNVPSEELEAFVVATEKKLGHRFPEGHGPHQPLRPTLDSVNIQHRPLVYYIFGVGLMDTLVFLKLWRMGFEHYPVSRWFQFFPFRPLSVFSKQVSPARDVSYWYRPHTSSKHLPVLFIHGIGIGLVTYTEFFAELIEMNKNRAPDDQIGVIALEIMPISFRVTSQTLEQQIMLHQIHQILHLHSWDRRQFALVAHSYGTVIATHLVRDPSISSSIAPVVLVDPINVWVHMGDVAYNFTAKTPRSASEHQLHYFACTDMGAAHAVTRRFVWTENVLWKDELATRPYGIVLGGRDIILDGKRCKDYLLAAQSVVQRKLIGTGGRDEFVKTKQIELLWFEDLNHAEVFENLKPRKLLVDMVWRSCCGSW